jgi:hypothetical protein
MLHKIAARASGVSRKRSKRSAPDIKQHTHRPNHKTETYQNNIKQVSINTKKPRENKAKPKKQRKKQAPPVDTRI